MEFAEWWAEFRKAAAQWGIGLPLSDPEAYRPLHDDDISPMRAVVELAMLTAA